MLVRVIGVPHKVERVREEPKFTLEVPLPYKPEDEEDPTMEE
jgi:hypothetical protein